jgi:hypothetical protein
MLIFYNEMKLLEENYPETLDIMATENIQLALSQLEYYDVHSGFEKVKNAVVRSFLDNQEASLKHHINDRAINLLKMAKQYEMSNQKAILNQITKSVLDEIAVIQAKPNKEILDAAFKSALTGIKEGKMTYEGDLVLPTIKQNIEKTINHYKTMKPDE